MLILQETMNDKESPQSEGQREMSFLDHLEELRWDIVRALAGILVATILCAVYAEFIVGTILLGPLRAAGLAVQVLSPYGIVLLYMQAVLICGLILSMPHTLYWLWRFIKPGLLPKERKYISWLVFFTSICFFAGVAFSYFIVIPTALNFFSTFGTQDIALNISVDRYVSFVLTLLLGAGLVFELPMVSYLLSKMGILTPAFMRHYRRHAIVGILIVSAIITPTPDIVTQLLLAVPMIALYEVGIGISSIVQRKREKQFEEPSIRAEDSSL
jgi:sec-independent protein translocase protein TatC